MKPAQDFSTANKPEAPKPPQKPAQPVKNPKPKPEPRPTFNCPACGRG